MTKIYGGSQWRHIVGHCGLVIGCCDSVRPLEHSDSAAQSQTKVLSDSCVSKLSGSSARITTHHTKYHMVYGPTIDKINTFSFLKLNLSPLYIYLCHII